MEPYCVKRCPRCGDTKEAKEFSVKRMAKSGLQSYCKQCHPRALAEYRRKRKEAEGQSFKPYKSRYEQWPRKIDELGNVVEFNGDTVESLRGLLKNAKTRAKEKGYCLNIDIQDVASVYVDKCPLLGVDLSWKRNGVALANSPSLDRIDPSLGYIRGNIWIISHRANTIKSDATPQELLAVANALLAR